jgi:hypothetical protein
MADQISQSLPIYSQAYYIHVIKHLQESLKKIDDKNLFPQGYLKNSRVNFSPPITLHLKMNIKILYVWSG